MDQAHDFSLKRIPGYARKMRLLALPLALSLISLPSLFGQDASDVPVIRARVDVVNILATVRDKRGRYIKNLSKDDFEVLEDGVRQQIEFFSYESGEDSQPLTIVLALDTSGSIKKRLDFEQQAATEFLSQVLREGRDMAALMQFDSELTLAQDFTFDLSVLKQAIFDVRAGGATKLFDAIFVASEDLLAPEVGRRVLVVLSDGEDTQSKLSDREAIRAAQNRDVVIFGIGLKSRGSRADFGNLRRFAESTGGVFYAAKNDLDRLREVFGQINQEIRNQVSLGYISSNPKRDGEFRHIEVRVKRGGLKVTHRTGYYAPEPSS